MAASNRAYRSRDKNISLDPVCCDHSGAAWAGGGKGRERGVVSPQPDYLHFKLGISVTGICVGPDQSSAVWDNLPVLFGVRGSHHEVTLPGQTLDIRSSQLYTISSSLSSVSGISS